VEVVEVVEEVVEVVVEVVEVVVVVMVVVVVVGVDAGVEGDEDAGACVADEEVMVGVGMDVQEAMTLIWKHKQRSASCQTTEIHVATLLSTLAPRTRCRGRRRT
jgi:hypothetical protein